MDTFRMSEMDDRADEKILSHPPIEGIFAAECILKKRTRKVRFCEMSQYNTYP